MDKQQYLDKAIEKIFKTLSKNYDKKQYKKFEINSFITETPPITPIITVKFPNNISKNYDLRISYKLYNRDEIPFKESFKVLKSIILDDIDNYINPKNKIEENIPIKATEELINSDKDSNEDNLQSIYPRFSFDEDNIMNNKSNDEIIIVHEDIENDNQQNDYEDEDLPY